MQSEQGASTGVYVGGTAIATVVALVVIMVVSTVVAFLFGMMQYYLTSMRWEAAIVVGNIAGGGASIYAARQACDSTIKRYSIKTVASILLTLFAILTVFQLTKGMTQVTLFRLATIIPMIVVTWIVFWKDDF